MSKKRKKQSPRPPRAVPGVKVLGMCDDCNSEAVMIEHPGVGTELRILHDETCPSYRARQAEREKGES